MVRIIEKDDGKDETIEDILFHTENYVFSYRIAGILINENKILLQKPTNEEDGYAFPGGHVSFGETNEETLIREFKEEINIDIKVNELKWVAEIFCPWGKKKMHQICLYYMVKLNNFEQIPLNGKFIGNEQIEGRNFKIEFYWIPINEINKITIYPNNVYKLLNKLDEGMQHFVYKEEE
jgi:ADP-ribose pyrophosphatase YjhB (NUDIX family)